MTSAPVYAALDLGSNSFHLLIAAFADDRLVVIDNIKMTVRLAGGLDRDKYLSDEVMQRACVALRLLADRLQHIERRYLRITGTSTLRQARNADVFLEQAEKILNAPVDIISGIEEARLIYLGVSKDYSPSVQRLVIDIGGGSTECVVGRLEAEQLASLHLGCVTFTERFFKNGKVDAENYQQALTAARLEARDVAYSIGKSRWQEAVGASGTIKAVQDILLQQWQQPLITCQGLELLVAAMLAKGHAEQFDFAGLSESRRHILAGGVAILHGLFIELAIDEMHTTDHAIREGVIYELAGQVVQKGRHDKTIRQLQRQYRVDTRQAKRVAKLALKLFDIMDQTASNDAQMQSLLRYAAALHEIGLPINHSGYHKHGAYIIESSFMPGFSRQMQQSLAWLVLNHRRKIRDGTCHYRVMHDRRLLIALRLAFLFCRRRVSPVLPKKLAMYFADNTLTLDISKKWLAVHPMSLADLQQESAYLHNSGITLILNGKTL